MPALTAPRLGVYEFEWQPPHMDDDQDWPTAGLADAADLASEAQLKIFEADDIQSGLAGLIKARSIVDRVNAGPAVSMDFAGHAAETWSRYAMERLTERGATPKNIGVTACMIRPHAENGELIVERNLYDKQINGRAIGLFVSAALAESMLHEGTARGGIWLRRARQADRRMADIGADPGQESQQQLDAARNMLNRFDGRKQPPFRTWQDIGHAGLTVLVEPPDLEKYARP